MENSSLGKPNIGAPVTIKGLNSKARNMSSRFISPNVDVTKLKIDSVVVNGNNEVIVSNRVSNVDTLNGILGGNEENLFQERVSNRIKKRKSQVLHLASTRKKKKVDPYGKKQGNVWENN